MKIAEGMMETYMTCDILVVKAYWESETPLCKALREDLGIETLEKLACVPLWHLEDDYMLFVLV